MARATMTELIDKLRVMTSAARTDIFGGVTYWTDDQLEDMLDQSKVGPPVQLPLEAGTAYNDGEVAWWFQRVLVPAHYGVERTDVIRTSAGTAIAGAPEFTHEGHYLQWQLTPSATITNQSYVVDLELYNMNMAAGKVWEAKAAQRQALVDVRSGVHQIKASQDRDFCAARAAYYFAKTATVVDIPSRTSRFRTRNSTLSVR